MNDGYGTDIEIDPVSRIPVSEVENDECMPRLVSNIIPTMSG
jgi:hypothetical protein